MDRVAARGTTSEWVATGFVDTLFRAMMLNEVIYWTATVSIAQAARDLGVGQNVLGRWVREAAAEPKQAFPGRGQMKPDDAEVARLKRELAKTKGERDILKKPSASS